MKHYITTLALICTLNTTSAYSAPFLPTQQPYGVIVTYLHTEGKPEPLTFVNPSDLPYFNVEIQPYAPQTAGTWGSGFPLFYINMVNNAGPFATQRNSGTQVTDTYFRTRLEEASTELATLSNVIEVKQAH